MEGEKTQGTTEMPTDQTKETVEQERVARSSREPLFGTLLFSLLLLCTLLSLAGIGWVLYSRWQESREQAGQLSIATLPLKSSESSAQETAASNDTETPSEEHRESSSSAETAILAPKDVDVKVLNGGAAKGSAGTVTETLKQAGYSKATFGNATGDYSGVTVYYAASAEREALAVKEALVKKYPMITAKSSVAGNTETSVASVTVILGK